MRNRLIAVALLFGISTPALAQGTCYDQTVVAMSSFWPGGAASMTPAGVNAGIQQAGVSLLVQKVSPKVDEVCRPYVTNNAKAYAGLGQPAEPAVAAPPASKPALSATPTSAPASAKSVTIAQPGSVVDQQIRELQARDGAGNAVAAEAAARRAEEAAAEAKRDRDAAAARLEQAKARPGVSRAEVASATNALRAAEAKLTEMRRLEALAKASANAAAKSAGDSATSAGQSASSATAAAGSATTAKSEADKAEAAAKRAEATAVWSFWDWFWWVPILIGMAGIVLWVKKTRRSNEQADKKFATKTETLSVEVRGANFEDLKLLKDGDAKPLEFLASDGRAFPWPFGRKDGMWFTPTGGIDHNPQHDLITDPAKTIQNWVRKGQITI